MVELYARMPIGYTVVFDISNVGYKAWSFAAVGLVFIAVGIGTFVFANVLPFRWSKPAAKYFRVFFLGYAVVWTISVFDSTYRDYRLARDARASHRFKVAEGLVQDFRPMPYGGHSMEHFCVDEACFEYSDYVITPGFNNTASHGGPIREGLPVRVFYVGNTIIRLEVAKQNP